MIPNLEQIKMKVNNLRKKKEDIQKQIDGLQEEIDGLRDDKDEIQKQIELMVGRNEMDEDADAAVTTTTAGNISTLGGSGNYAPKIGKIMKRKKKHSVSSFIDKLFDKGQ